MKANFRFKIVTVAAILAGLLVTAAQGNFTLTGNQHLTIDGDGGLAI